MGSKHMLLSKLPKVQKFSMSDCWADIKSKKNSLDLICKPPNLIILIGRQYRITNVSNVTSDIDVTLLTPLTFKG